MNPEEVFCPNMECPARGQAGKGNIRIHSQKDKRYFCEVCQDTFTTTKGTIFYRLRHDPKIVMYVIILLAYGCPIQVIVKAFELDERTVSNWQDRAGKHCQNVHEHLVEKRVLGIYERMKSRSRRRKDRTGWRWQWPFRPGYG